MCECVRVPASVRVCGLGVVVRVCVGLVVHFGGDTIYIDLSCCWFAAGHEPDPFPSGNDDRHSAFQTYSKPVYANPVEAEQIVKMLLLQRSGRKDCFRDERGHSVCCHDGKKPQRV